MKTYVPDTHYHVYNRGVNGLQVFVDDEDYRVFCNLLKRHLSPEPLRDPYGVQYHWLGDDIQLEAFCLMSNHIHLLFYQVNQNALPVLMKAVTGAYTRYFNKKYDRYGPLFQGVYKAVIVDSDSYLQHISRYIHLNPSNYKTHPWSSLQFYYTEQKPQWMHPELIEDLFESRMAYDTFVADYEDYKSTLDELKSKAANQ